MIDKNVILSAKDLTVRFRVRGRELTAIRGISMDFYEGETVAIVGVSILAVVSFAWNIILLNKNANLEKGVAAIQEEKQIYYNYWIDNNYSFK